MSGPQPFRYEGDGLMQALRPRAADRQFVVGEVYTMVAEQPRSTRSMGMFFASVAEAWRNLPDDLAEEYPDAETLRKKALIRTGSQRQRSIVCASKAEARRVAAFIEPMDRYAIVAVSEAVVRVYTRALAIRCAMGRKNLPRAWAVLAFCAGLIGVAPDDLMKAEAA